MEELLIDLGRLISLEHINRDTLAHALGMDRSNLLSALRGRRSLPAVYLPSLRSILHLDDDYRLKPGRVHGLWVKNGYKQKDDLVAVFRRFFLFPLQNLCYLRGIGEDGRESFAYVFEDGRGVMVAVRNDDALLAVKPQENETGTSPNAEDELFRRDHVIPEREMPIDSFIKLFAWDDPNKSEAEFRAVLNRDAKVWTWARLREKAEMMGLSAEMVAQKMGAREN